MNGTATASVNKPASSAVYQGFLPSNSIWQPQETDPTSTGLADQQKQPTILTFLWIKCMSHNVWTRHSYTITTCAPSKPDFLALVSHLSSFAGNWLLSHSLVVSHLSWQLPTLVPRTNLHGKVLALCSWGHGFEPGSRSLLHKCIISKIFGVGRFSHEL